MSILSPFPLSDLLTGAKKLHTTAQLNESSVQNVTFHNAATTPGTGNVFTVGGAKTLTIEISGTSTSRTITFDGAGMSGTYHPIAGINLITLLTDVSTIGTGELWRFDITGLVSVRMNLTAVAGGNVTILGQAVA